MKKIIVFVLSAIITLSLAACGSNEKTAEIPNPFTEYSSIDEAVKAVGLEISVPDSIDGYADRIIRVDPDHKMIEVIYKNSDDAEIRIRKAVGSEDVSGDYTKYAQSSATTIGDLNVTMKGANDKVSVAVWTNGDYAYSITCSTAQNKAKMTDLVNAVDAVDMIGGDPATWGPALDADDDPDAEIPNPYVEYSSFSEAAKAVGFDIIFPEMIDGYSAPVIRVDAEGQMVEAIYTKGDGSELCIRKAVGSEDVSGDYNEYSRNDTMSVGDLTVTMKGENELVSHATWTNNGYTYSIGVYMQAGVSVGAMTALVCAVQ